MAAQVHIPQWGMAMKEGKIACWLKKEGASVQEGEPLFEVETEKITNTAEVDVTGMVNFRDEMREEFNDDQIIESVKKFLKG